MRTVLRTSAGPLCLWHSASAALLAKRSGKKKTNGLGDMLMLWDGNVSNVLFEAGSEAVLSSQ